MKKWKQKQCKVVFTFSYCTFENKQQNQDRKHFLKPQTLLIILVSWNYSFEFSVKHEYDGEWDNTRCLTTCDPHAKKLVSGSEPPQEVEDKEGDYFYLWCWVPG